MSNSGPIIRGLFNEHEGGAIGFYCVSQISPHLVRVRGPNKTDPEILALVSQSTSLSLSFPTLKTGQLNNCSDRLAKIKSI